MSLQKTNHFNLERILKIIGLLCFLVCFNLVSSCYALEYQKKDTERMLTCSAFLTYPAPNITWVMGNKTIQETHREETRDGILYSLRSHQGIITTSDPYSCHIPLPQGKWTAEWRMKGRNKGRPFPATLWSAMAGF